MSLVLGSWCRPRIVLLAEGFIPGAWDEDFIDGLPTAFLLLDFGNGGQQRAEGSGTTLQETITYPTKREKDIHFQKCLGNKDMLVPSGVGLFEQNMFFSSKKGVCDE